jgi:flagellar motor protein MotB
MKSLPAMGLCLAMLGLFSTGCQSKLYDENQSLYRQNRELQSKLDEKDAQLRQAADPAQLQVMQSQIADREKSIADRDAKIADLEAQLRQPVANAPADAGLAGIETSYNAVAGQLTVNVPGDVLFASGQSDVKSSADATLNKIIAAVKKDYSGKKIYVDGYTDSDPISKTKNKYEDNLDLSAARARSVAKYLTAHGLSVSQVAPRAFGSTNAKASKAKSRRVEIVVQVK